MLHAGLWSMALHIGLRIFSVTRIIVIARILSPASFGTYGVALLVIALQETLLQRVMFAALIQKKDDIESYLDTVWTFRLIVNAIPLSVIFILTPQIAAFMHAPDAVWLIRAMLLTVMIKSLANIGVVYFERDLDSRTS